MHKKNIKKCKTKFLILQKQMQQNYKKLKKQIFKYKKLQNCKKNVFKN